MGGFSSVHSRFASLSLILLLAFGTDALALNGDSVVVDELVPAPNYGANSNQYDLRDLTDGKALKFPIWTRKGSVGWQAVTPVVIRMRVVGTLAERRPLSGELSFHTAKGIYAGVYPPKRIDLYSLASNGRYVHVGSAQQDSSSFEDRSNAWIRLSVSGAEEDVVAVIHAEKNYFMLDEITWSERIDETDESDHESAGTDLQMLIADSIGRLKGYYRNGNMASAEIRRGWTRSFGNGAIVSWVTNCWGQLDPHPSADGIAASPRQVEIVGYSQERESFCVGILNPSHTDTKVHLGFGDEPIAMNGNEIRRIDRVLAANGRTVFDPLVPISLEDEIEVASQQVSYVMLTADLAKFVNMETYFHLQVRDTASGTGHDIPVTIKVVEDIEPKVEDRPDAICWAYTNDGPIWSSHEKAMDDLISHGINVFVVHSAHIPLPTLDGQVDADRLRRLEQDARLYAGRGKILLFLMWEPGRRPVWLNVHDRQSRETQVRVLGRWLTSISATMAKAGVRKNEWAIYPMDEISGSKIELFAELASWIRMLDPEVQIYANPTSYSGSQTSLYDLQRLTDLVDIWQPNLVLARESAEQLFSRLGKRWWIYSGPAAPAKVAEPMTQYRMLAWRAWSLGASGVGVWAYSDTGRSSAWEDFDGRRPDYAMVYEGADGPVSSRRWEAFRDGLEDYQLLSVIERGREANTSINILAFRDKVRRVLSNDSISDSDVAELRNELLGVETSISSPK